MPIQVDKITIQHEKNGRSVLEGASATFADGQITLCIGKTGAGKSTLLDAIGGLIQIHSGSITIDGTDLWNKQKLTPGLSLRLGSVFQYPEHQLFAKSVLDEFKYSLQPMRLSKDEITKRAVASLQELGLTSSILPESPLTLSGGQKRRIALATTYSAAPEWLLLDEPTAGLDPESVQQLLSFLAAWKASHPSGGFIVATHDLDVFLPIADSVVLLHQGKIVRQAPAEELFNHPEWLLNIGVSLPESLKLRRALGHLGMTTPGDVNTPEKLAATISDWIQELKTSKPEVAVAATSVAAESDAPVAGNDGETAAHLMQNVNFQESSTRPMAESPANSMRGFRSLDPRAKWLICVLLSAAILIQSTWLGVTASLILTAVLIVVSGVSRRSVMQITKPFVSLLAVSVILSALQFGANEHIGPWHGARLSVSSALTSLQGLLRVLCVMEIGLLLPATTSQLEMKQALEQMLGTLRFLRFPVDAFALAASLLLRFIPVILQQLQRFSRIARARAKHNTSVGKLRMRDVPAIVIPLVLSVLQLGEDLSLAMEARGYRHTAQKRTTAIRLRMQKQDAWALICATFVCLLLLLIHW